MIIGLLVVFVGLTAAIIIAKFSKTFIYTGPSGESELEDLSKDAEKISAFSALYNDNPDSMRITVARMMKNCEHNDGKHMRGIYVDFIYNPKYYFELTVLRQILLDILTGNPQLPYYYDNVHYSNSTIITVGYEHMVSRFSERSVITMKPKLLKDILYTANIFDQIYNFLLSYFRSCISDPTLVPEYDRTINFKRYRNIFADSIVSMDEHNQATTICRNIELYNDENEGRVCIVPVVNASEFKDPNTAKYWSTILSRLSNFMSELLESTFMMQAFHDRTKPCYRIELKPESDIRRVLLFPHAAVKTAPTIERLAFNLDNKKRIADDLILFKHRVLHAFGVGHRYSRRSIMNSYDNDWQYQNLFAIMPEDYMAMSRCYGSNQNLNDLGIRRTANVVQPMLSATTNRNVVNDKKYVTDLRQDDITDSLLNLFITDYDKFMFEIKSNK